MKLQVEKFSNFLTFFKNFPFFKWFLLWRKSQKKSGKNTFPSSDLVWSKFNDSKISHFFEKCLNYGENEIFRFSKNPGDLRVKGGRWVR